VLVFLQYRDSFIGVLTVKPVVTPRKATLGAN
jgi:hypothetical protein